jgi:hypothetical protein
MSEHRKDVQDRVIEAVGEKVARRWGVGRAVHSGGVEMSSNVLANRSKQLAVLYDRRPIVTQPDDELAGDIIGSLLADAGFHALMQTVQYFAIGLNEMVLAPDVHIVAGRPKLSLRKIFPDMVEGTPAPHDTNRPIRFRELRTRPNPASHPDKGKVGWYWDLVDLTDPTNPTWRILDARLERDWTAAFAGAPNGFPARFVDSDGYGRMPYIVYHAAKTGDLWATYAGRELVEGTLNACVFTSHWSHSMKHASAPTRGTIGAAPLGDGEDGVVEADNTFVLQLSADDGFQGTPTTFQWGPGANVSEMAETVQMYERRVFAAGSTNGSDFVRMSGDPRSAYALAISREDRREASRAYEPTFGEADAELCAVIAVALNRLTGSSLPESGYQLTYPALPLSSTEKAAVRQEVFELLDRGLIDDDEARVRLFEAGIVRTPNRPEPRATRPSEDT